MGFQVAFLSRYLILAALLFSTEAFAQKEDPLRPNWNNYHSTADTQALLEGWARAYPNLTSLYSIGQTLKGTSLTVLEITNKDTGEPDTKPGYYYDGNIHAEELTGAAHDSRPCRRRYPGAEGHDFRGASRQQESALNRSDFALGILNSVSQI